MGRQARSMNTQHLAIPRSHKDPYAPSQVHLNNPYPQDDAVDGGDGGLNARSDGTGLAGPPEFFNDNNVTPMTSNNFNQNHNYSNNVNSGTAVNVGNVGNVGNALNNPYSIIDLAGGDFLKDNKSLSSRTRAWSIASAVILILVVLTFMMKPNFDVPYKYPLLGVAGLALIFVVNQKGRLVRGFDATSNTASAYVTSVLLYYLLIFALLIALSGFTLNLGGDSKKYYLLAGIVAAIGFIRVGIVSNLGNPFTVIGQTWTTDNSPQRPQNE